MKVTETSSKSGLTKHIETGAWFKFRIVRMAALVALAVSPVPLIAGVTEEAYWEKLPTARVINNTVEYTELTDTELVFEGHVYIEVGSPPDGFISSFSTWPYIHTGGTLGSSNIDLSSAKISRSWTHLLPTSRPDKIDQSETFSVVPDQSMRNRLVWVCNKHADKLRQQGYGDAYIFGNSHEVQLKVDQKLNVSAYGGLASGFSSHSPGNITHMRVICEKHAGSSVATASDLASTDGQVVDTTLTLTEHAPLTGQCSVTVSGVIKTDLPSMKVSFRYKHSSGKTSEVKTVTTEAHHAFFSHEYDIPNNEGDETGWIRFVGVGRDFRSEKRHYDMNCHETADSFETVLPPILKIDPLVEETSLVDGQSCPTTLRWNALIEARSEVTGDAFLVGTDYFSPKHEVSMHKGDKKLFAVSQKLNWQSGGPAFEGQPSSGEAPLKSKTISMAMKIVKDGEVVYAGERKSLTITCEKPLPPVVKIDVVPEDIEMVNNQICPTTARLVAFIDARGQLQGKGAFVGTDFFSAPQPIALQSGEKELMGAERPINWGHDPKSFTSPSSGELPLQTQSFNIGFNIVGDDNEIVYSHPQKRFEVACRRPKLNTDILGSTGELTVAPQTPKQAVPVFGGQVTAKQTQTATLKLPNPGLPIDNVGARGTPGMGHSATRKTIAVKPLNPAEKGAIQSVPPRLVAVHPEKQPPRTKPVAEPPNEPPVQTKLVAMPPKKPGRPDVQIVNVKRSAKHSLSVQVGNKKGREVASDCTVRAHIVRKNNAKKTVGKSLAAVHPGQTVSVVLDGVPRKKKTKQVVVKVRCPGENNLADNSYTLN